MATGTLSPSPYLTVLDANGLPCSGALITTYLAGTTTLAPTYTDVNLAVANTNPIVADSAGRYLAFLSPGASYKFVVTTSASVAIRTVDNISAVPASSSNLDITGVAGEALTAGQPVYLSDGSGGKTAGSWYLTDADFTYASTLPEVGMVPATMASGATGTIRLGGSATGQSGLVVGTTYYISATAGAITSTAPTNARIMGVADTTSTLVLFPALPTANSWVTWTPTAAGFTNAGTPTYAGRYLAIGHLVHFQIRITTTGTTSVAAAGAGSLTLPSTPTQTNVCICTNESSVANNGVGLIFTDGKAYLPAYAATAAGVVLSGWYEL